jgi:hypothetical protein
MIKRKVSKAYTWLESEQEKRYNYLQRLEYNQIVRNSATNSRVDRLEQIKMKQKFYFDDEYAYAQIRETATYIGFTEGSKEYEEYVAEQITDRNFMTEFDLPTRFEDPWGYLQMLKLASEIEKSISQIPYLAKKLRFHPLFGTLPYGNVNAAAVLIPKSKEYLVVFEPELFTFALLVSKLVTISIATIVSSGDGWEDRYTEFCSNDEILAKTVLENPYMLDLFQDLLFAYILDGMPSSAHPYQSTGIHADLAGDLLHAMELFVMGHEYGHVLAGHLPNKSTIIQGLADRPRELLANIWGQELQADTIGLDLVFMASALRGTNGELGKAFAGADLFFSIIDIVERSIGILRTGDENQRPIPSHPPIVNRREHLRNYARERLSGYIYDVTKLGGVVERIVEILWKETVPVLTRYYKEGRQPSPIWTSHELISLTEEN